MPAYFTLMMEFSRYEVDLDTVEKLDKAFEIVGLKFKSGFWGKAEDRTKEEIILHNQTLLEEDFMLGAAQNHDEGYWQSEYEYEVFSSVILTPAISSPSSSPIAIRPFLRTFL